MQDHPDRAAAGRSDPAAAGRSDPAAAGRPDPAGDNRPEGPRHRVRGGLPVRRLAVIVAAVGVVWTMFDQLTKWWALSTLSGREPLAIVWTLQLQIARNTGAAFSFGSGNGITRFLPLLVLAVVGWVVWQQRESMTRTGAVAVGMIVGGAVGNIVDRAFRTSGGGFYSGGVVDFINFQWWPVFNIADSGVVVGGILLAAVSLWSAREADGSDDPAAGNGGGEPVVPS